MSNKLEIICRYYIFPKGTKGEFALKAVLYFLCGYADDTGLCYPSYSTLAVQLRTTKANVINKIRDLENLGLIEITKDKANSGRNAVNRYVISEQVMLDSIIERDGGLNKHILSILKRYKKNEDMGIDGIPTNKHSSNESDCRMENFEDMGIDGIPTRVLVEYPHGIDGIPTNKHSSNESDCRMENFEDMGIDGIPTRVLVEYPHGIDGIPESLINNQLITKEDTGSGSNKNLTIDLPQSENLIIREANEAQLHIWLNLRAFTKSEPSQKNVVIGSMPRTSDLDLIDWVIEIAAECDCDLTSREDCIRFCQAALMELNTKNNNQADTANIFYRLKLAENATYDEEGSFPSWPERLGKWLL